MEREKSESVHRMGKALKPRRRGMWMGRCEVARGEAATVTAHKTKGKKGQREKNGDRPIWHD